MKRTPFTILFFLLPLSGSSILYSQQSNGELNAIQSVVPFLTIAPDSRAGGIGDAGVATSPDVYSIHWNPAKYVFIKGNEGVGISYSPWLRNLVPDVNIAYLAGYKRLDSKQVLSASLLYSSLGDIEFTDDLGVYERTFKPNEFAFDAAYSRLLTKNISGGIAFRFIYSNLAGGSFSGGAASKAGISFAADVSGYYQKDISVFSNDGVLGFGLNISNIGSKMSYSDGQIADFIPMNLRLGSAVTVNLNKYNKVTLIIDINKLLIPTPPVYSTTNPDSIVKGKNPDISVPLAFFQSFYDAPGGLVEELHEITYSYGLEYWYNNQFAIRGGYFHENETKGNRKFFTAGAGFRLKQFVIDFSYLMPLVQNHPLAQTLRFSLAFNLNAPDKTTAK